MKKGRNIIGRLGYGLLGLMAVMGLAGCGKETAREPVTVTIWHVYGGQAESPLNDMIAEFNETVGKGRKYPGTGGKCHQYQYDP